MITIIVTIYNDDNNSNDNNNNNNNNDNNSNNNSNDNNNDNDNNNEHTHTQYTIMSIFQIAVENGPFDDLHIMIYLQTMAIPVARCNYQRAIDL